MKLPHSCKREEWKGVPQVAIDPFFYGKKVAIIGYSARALNYTAKSAGFQTLVFDCFADMDLRRSADEFIHVNLDEHRTPEGNLEFSAAYYLNQEVYTQIQKIQQMDYVLLGSSFENDIPAWTRASDFKNYVGNHPSSAKNVRNPFEFFPILLKHNIKFPRTLVVTEIESMIEIQAFNSSSTSKHTKESIHLNEIYETVHNFISPPFILKSSNSGGGLGIFLINTKEEFIERYDVLKKLRKSPYIIQEYIQGTPMSCSFLAKGTNAKIHTISEQIIGDTRFGCKGKFTYCGNIMNETISNPQHENNDEITPQLEKIAQILTEFGELKGSNGIDFVIYNNGGSKNIYFIELNPRFQGTIDLVLASTGENIIQHHIKSIEKSILPPDVCFPDNKTYLKIIYYSPLDFHIMVDLQGLEFRDVPLIGSFLPNSAPICSNIVIGDSPEDAFDKALEDRDLMIRVLGLKSRIVQNDAILKR